MWGVGGDYISVKVWKFMPCRVSNPWDILCEKRIFFQTQMIIMSLKVLDIRIL